MQKKPTDELNDLLENMKPNQLEAYFKDNGKYMADEKKVITLDDFEQRLMVSGLMDFRNDLLKEEKPTEDINDLILKVIDAPTKKEKRKADREER